MERDFESSDIYDVYEVSKFREFISDNHSLDEILTDFLIDSMEEDGAILSDQLLSRCINTYTLFFHHKVGSKIQKVKIPFVIKNIFVGNDDINLEVDHFDIAFSSSIESIQKKSAIFHPLFGRPQWTLCAKTLRWCQSRQNLPPFCELN